MIYQFNTFVRGAVFSLFGIGSFELIQFTRKKEKNISNRDVNPSPIICIGISIVARNSLAFTWAF